ncbi:hypothetical protein LUZ60_009135 [Juncus effusus]|nr:hypothetical protein LUZ60_009135 [Juncus effusus]
MGEEMIQADICTSSGIRWWNAIKTSPSFDGHVSPPVTCSPLDVACTIGFNWPASDARVETRSRSSIESPGSASNSSITYVPDQTFNTPIMMPSTPQLMGFDLSTPVPDWNQHLLNNNSAQADQACYTTMYQEDMGMKPYFVNQNHIRGDNIALNQALSLQDPNNQFISGSDTSELTLPTSLEFQSTLLRSLLEPSNRAPLPSNPNHPMGFPLSDGFSLNANSSHFDKVSNTRQPIQFSNDALFWNPSNNSNFGTSMPHCNSLALKTAMEGKGESGSMVKRKTENQSSFKKPRMESTPSPLPTFKVRKEKLGDRITALQQLVSPFGKTDTASVLHETIEYIKFLHDQVGALSAPYLKNGHQMQHIKNLEKLKESSEGTKRDLISRGLCLVPISSTFAVASEVPVDIWGSAFGTSFR